MQKMLSGGDNESNQTVDRIFSIGLHWTRKALLESIEMSKAPDPNLFSRPCIVNKLGITVKQRVEENFLDFDRSPTLREIKKAFSIVIDELSRDTTLLQSVMRSMRRRIDTVLTNGGGYTNC